VLNYLVRFGWSSGDQEIFSRAQLIELFNWDHLGKSDGKFDAAKFSDVAFEHLKNPELTSDDAYIQQLVPRLASHGLAVDEHRLKQVLSLIRERAHDLNDAVHHLDFYFRTLPIFDAKAQEKFLVADVRQHLLHIHDAFATLPHWDAVSLEHAFNEYGTMRDIKLKAYAQAVRVALTGRTASPGLFDVLVVLGRELSLARLQHAAGLCDAP
jgi:glutamyl-tRNA synthetase